MPTLHEAIMRHINYFLAIAQTADGFYSEEKTQEMGMKIFDRNREQIDLAIKQNLLQTPSNETDLLLAQFVDAVSSVGMMRYSVTETLIPLAEQKILAAQRLAWRDLEADALDGLGILYAFLGYLRQAINYFKMAMGVAEQTGEKDTQQEIQSHLQRAQKQLANRRLSSAPKVLEMLRLIVLQLKLVFASIRRNPFTIVALLNRIGNTYLSLERWDLSIRYFEKAILLSRKHSYRFGELEASMGLIQAKMSKDAANVSGVSTTAVHELINEFGFEWSLEFDIFETLLELAPVIKNVEMIANHLEKNNDIRAIKIYQLLDQILNHTNEITLKESKQSAQRSEMLIDALESIKDNLAKIVQIASDSA